LTQENPSVFVLLATHNGQSWITEQGQSILCQANVIPSVCVSDDNSTDNTLAAIKKLISDLYILPPSSRPLGNACRNFIYLIESAEIHDCAYVALADQDDVWFEDKLYRAISLLDEEKADFYSSNVIAFWPDGRQRLICKSGPQRPFDFLFESSGPGCTFVMSRRAFIELQNWVRSNAEQLQNLKVHDWLIYAFARQRRFKWVIDSRPGMYYRQHERNQIGANIGVRAAWSRLKNVLSGQFRLDVLALAKVIGNEAPPIRALERFSWGDRLRLFFTCRDFRRNGKQAWLLGLMFLGMKKLDT
jgi:rhamnosyltransferase